MNSFIIAASLTVLATLGPPAPLPVLCSVVPIASYRDTGATFFVGVGAPDTVRAGRGSTRVGSGRGHWGRATGRPIFGQVVRVGDALGGAALPALERAFAKLGRREVVVVPWDYAPDCEPVPWGRSARWVETTEPGFFRARPRPESQWLEGGRPVLDAYWADLEPYPHGVFFQRGYRGTDALKTAPSLTPDEYFGLYAVLPDQTQYVSRSDSALTALAVWERAHPEVAKKYPAPRILDFARRFLERRR